MPSSASEIQDTQDTRATGTGNNSSMYDNIFVSQPEYCIFVNKYVPFSNKYINKEITTN